MIDRSFPAGHRRALGLRLALSTALRYLVRRRSRTATAILAAALGAGVLAASSALTSSAQAAVTQQFLNLKSTRLVATSTAARPDWTSDQQVANTARLPGVRSACLRASAVENPAVRTSLLAPTDYQAPAYSISEGCLTAMGLAVTDGREFSAHDHTAGGRTIILGSAVASALGMNTLTGDDRVYLGADPYSVIGIVTSSAHGEISAPLNVYLPSRHMIPGTITAWRNTEAVIDTDPAATDPIAAALPLSLEPAEPGDVFVLVGDIPTGLRSAVSDQLTLLLTALGVFSVVIGLFVIGNQTLQSVALRRPEIALRRALGQPRHIVLAQIVTETSCCGATGGLLGALAGELVAAWIATDRGWPPLTDIRLVALTAVAGAIVGAVAGVYPAHIAARTDPADTLRTG